jgi:hypothetical protein
MHFCADVWPFFNGPAFTVTGVPGLLHAGSCASPNCHGAPQTTTDSPRFPTGQSEPAEGLVLDTSKYVAETAIGRVANESNVGASASAGTPGAIFGIDMPIIDPGTTGTGDPGNSWMMYKVLLDQPLPEALDSPLFSVVCGPFSTAESYERGVSPVITPDERERLSNFIPGREMPYPTPIAAGLYPDGGSRLMIPSASQAGGASSLDALTLPEMERLRLWIKQGAQFDEFTLPDGGTTTECNSCKFPPAPDAGAMKEGGTKDAASDTGSAKDGASDAGAKD